MNNHAEMPRNRSTAFTLIELLVVIAIIAIIAATLFPVFARARENARRTSCASNCKQLALGFLQYAQDFDEQYPTGGGDGAGYLGGGLGMGWGGQIYPYLKSAQIFQCPSESATATGLAVPVSYAYAISIGRNDRPEIGIFARVTKLTNSSKSILLCEVAGNKAAVSGANEGGKSADHSPVSDGVSVYGQDNSTAVGTFGTGYMGRRGDTTGNSSGNPAAFVMPKGRHLDTSNFVFADGHVKALRGDGVSTGNVLTLRSDCPQHNNGDPNDDGCRDNNFLTTQGNFSAAAGTEGTIGGASVAATFNPI